jgi:hypothetical protein
LGNMGLANVVGKENRGESGLLWNVSIQPQWHVSVARYLSYNDQIGSKGHEEHLWRWNNDQQCHWDEPC